jgi:hypothetical protein
MRKKRNDSIKVGEIRERGREILMLREKYEGKKEKASMNIEKN